MTQTAIVHARIDTETKKATEKVLRTIGMTPTEAVRLLYRQIALRNEFPLELRAPNKVTAATLRKSKKNIEVESFDNLDELFASWQK
jgi:DNA-damage-inducible protein J